MDLLDRAGSRLDGWLPERFFGLRRPVIRALARLRLRRKLLNYVGAELELKLRRRRLWSKPYWLVIDPNSGCDLKCPLCPTGKGKGTRARAKMTWEHYTRLMDELGPWLLHVEFSNWGEPLLNPRIYDMIRYAKRYGVEVHLSSHFNHFDEAAAERLLDSGLDWMILSIDGASSETYSRYRIGGDFDKVVRNVRTLIAAKRRRAARKPFLIWQCLIFRHNEHEIDAVKALGEKVGVDTVGISAAAIPTPEMIPRGPGAYLYPERESQTKQEMTNAEDYEGNRRKELPLCVWPWLGSVVNSNGSVSPCCGIEDEKDDYGDAFAGSFQKIWSGRDYRVGRGFVDDRRPRSHKNTCTECRFIGKNNFHIPAWWSDDDMGGVRLEEVFRPLPWLGPEPEKPFRLRRLLNPRYVWARARALRSWDDLAARLCGLGRYAWGLLHNGFYRLRGQALYFGRRRAEFRAVLLLNPFYAACRLLELRSTDDLKERARNLARYANIRLRNW